MPSVLQVENLSKTFGTRRVLDSFRMEISVGEVHALVGQNGSGKSTLIRILAGFYTPDLGARIQLNGSDVRLPVRPKPGEPDPIGFVHQDLALVEGMSVAENLNLGHYQCGFGRRILWRAEMKTARESLERFGLDIDPRIRVEELSTVEKSLLAICRAVTNVGARPGSLLVLDEPTACLPRDSVETVFACVRRLASQGTSVLFVTHRLDEVMSLCNGVTVLRDGVVVKSSAIRDETEDSLIQAIVGRPLDEMYPTMPAGGEEPLLETRGLAVGNTRGVDLRLRRGEILGMTGLQGMGQDRLLYALAGASPADAGAVTIRGRPYDATKLTPRRAIELGIYLLPADRLRSGLVPEFTTGENVTLPALRTFRRRGRLRHAKERSAALRLLRQFLVQPRDPRFPISSLSGGNQQKVMIAKWFGMGPQVLLLHEPTQGVDVGARQQIFAMVRDASAEGIAIIIASTEYADLAHLCQRVWVYRDDSVTAELHQPGITEERIVEACFRSSPADRLPPEGTTTAPATAARRTRHGV